MQLQKSVYMDVVMRSCSVHVLTKTHSINTITRKFMVLELIVIQSNVHSMQYSVLLQRYFQYTMTLPYTGTLSIISDLSFNVSDS